MIRRVLCLICLVTAISTGSIYASTPVRVGIHNDVRALEFETSSGQPDGALVDLIKTWGNSSDKTVEFVFADNTDLLQRLESGSIDLIANAEISTQQLYSKPYFSHNYFLFCLKTTSLYNAKQLPIKLGIRNRDAGFVPRNILQSTRVFRFESFEAILTALDSGEIDYFIANDRELIFSISGPDIIRLSFPQDPFYQHKIRAAFRQSNEKLYNEFNSWIDVISDSTYQKISTRWAPTTVMYRFPWTAVIVSLFVITITVLAIAIWIINTRLKSQVAKATESLIIEKEAHRNAREEAEQANAAKSQFLANISHELRTPLIAVTGFSELLTNLVSDDVQKSYLDAIKSSGKSLLTLINDILDLSKLEAGKMELQLKPVCLQITLNEIEQIFLPAATEKQVVLEVESGEFPVLMLDETKILQILFNLVGNAIKFTSDGFIRIKVAVDKKDQEQCDVRMIVEDSGVGIKAEEQARIFEIFTQQTGGKAGYSGGTGLGLAITRRLVEVMQGQIRLDSKSDHGSKFEVLIPDVSTAPEEPQGNLFLHPNTSTVKTDLHHPSDRQFSILLDIDIDEVRDRAGLSTYLETYLLPEFRQQRKAMVMDDLATFCVDMEHAGREYNADNLVLYAQQMLRHIGHFDIASLEQMFHTFENEAILLIEQLGGNSGSKKKADFDRG